MGWIGNSQRIFSIYHFVSLCLGVRDKKRTFLYDKNFCTPHSSFKSYGNPPFLIKKSWTKRNSKTEKNSKTGKFQKSEFKNFCTPHSSFKSYEFCHLFTFFNGNFISCIYLFNNLAVNY